MKVIYRRANSGNNYQLLNIWVYDNSKLISLLTIECKDGKYIKNLQEPSSDREFLGAK